MPDETRFDWIARAKADGFGPPIQLMLDVLAPLGPLGAQALWVAQPALSIFLDREALDDIARSVETPEGIASLRARLDEDDDPNGA